MSESEKADQAAERRQQAIGVESDAARAAVLGINDGLVTNTALILGVVGPPTRSASCSSPGSPASSPARAPWPPVSTSRCALRSRFLERLLEDERQALIAAPTASAR